MAPAPVRTSRRILCVFPRYAPSFGTFQHAYPLMPGVRAFMPPQGLLLIAAYLPPSWSVRFIDQNIQPATDADYQWADAVFISGMHVQRSAILAIAVQARRHGKICVLGGPSVSACPEYYPGVDLLHQGEIGDATDALIRYLDFSVAPPARQLVFETEQRLPMEQFPVPAYHLIDLRRYFLGSVQFSSGCPFMCEFCDIPALYGRSPRLKPPERVTAELDAMLARGLRSAVYFVDDNFIANPAATRMLLHHLVEWQRARGYPLNLCCEATLNLAQFPDILDLMRRANFTTVFCGIETPEAEALTLMRKTQNMRQPLLNSVRTLNEHGLEVVSGIILGLDSDTEQTADHVLAFIEQSRIPMLTINLLYALPRTALFDRLHRSGRLVNEPGRASNVDFKLPYEQVLATWRRCIGEAYEPRNLLARFQAQCDTTFRNRLKFKRRVTPGAVAFGLRTLARTLYHVGVRGDFAAEYRRTCGPLLRAGRVEEVIHIGVVAHHLVRFTRDCLNGTGQGEAAFYADPTRSAPATPAPQPRKVGGRVMLPVLDASAAK